MKCIVCGIEFESKRVDAKYCSPKCRKEAFKRSIGTDKRSDGTDNVIIEERIIEPEIEFKFTIAQHPNSKPGDKNWDERKAKVRTERYWYEVPLAAVPVLQKGWPKMPEFMDGRQYFLWWKNEFKVNEDSEKGKLGIPVLHNPFPVRDNIRYEMGGEGSRRWGA